MQSLTASPLNWARHRAAPFYPLLARQTPSSASRRLVQPDDERYHLLFFPQTFGKLARSVFGRQAAGAHAVEQPLRGIVLHNDCRRVALLETLAETLGVLLIEEGAHLHGEGAGEWLQAGEQLKTQRRNTHRYNK